jgi:hypothetical protein
MALDLAFDSDAFKQFGQDAEPRVAELRAAANEVRRETLALAWALGDADEVIRLARTVLEGLGGERSELPQLAVSESRGHGPTPGDVFAAAMHQWREAVDHDTRRAAEATPPPGPTWGISGTYVEACNCEPICSRRHVLGGRRERRPTYGVCTGALSWVIEHGHAEDVDLGGLAIVLAFRYDDEPGSPWDFVLYLDDRADDRQRSALKAVFTGGPGLHAPVQFPWASKASHRVGVRAVPIGVDHHARRPWFDAGGYVSVRVGDPVRGPQPVASLIRGHRRAGVERRADRLCVADAPLAFEFNGRRAFQSTFDYASRHTA